MSTLLNDRCEDYSYSWGDTPPWFIGTAQPVINEFVNNNKIISPVLDLGCGDGLNALEIANRGYTVTGLDTCKISITKARKNKNKLLTFIQGNALYDLKKITKKPWKSVIDSGLLHSLTNEEQFTLVENVFSVLDIGGIYNLLCFSELETRPPKPRCLSLEHITTIFKQHFIMKAHNRVKFITKVHPGGAEAWAITFVKKIKL